MTKRVRVENADTSSFKVVVEVWDKGVAVPDGLGGFNTSADTLATTIHLNNPTDITDSSCYITSTRYLVVREA